MPMDAYFSWKDNNKLQNRPFVWQYKRKLLRFHICTENMPQCKGKAQVPCMTNLTKASGKVSEKETWNLCFYPRWREQQEMKLL